jgi:hypothetical protein
MQKVSAARKLLEDMLGDPVNKKFLSKKGPPGLVPYLGKRSSNRRVFKGDFDTGKVSWKRMH